MKWRIGASLIVACTLGIVLLKHYAAPAAQQSVAQTSSTEESAPTLSTTREAVDAHQSDGLTTFVPITGGRPRTRAPIDPFSRVPKTRNGLPLDNDVFVAKSVEEQRWLDRNGYPNSEQLSAYSSASTLTIEQAAAHGDQIAEVELASRQLLRGDPKAAGKLMTAGMNGSSFALSRLAAYLSSGKHGNPELGYAVSRVLELRGDWRAGIGREFGFEAPLTSIQKARAEGKALQILDSFRRHSPVQPYIDPRPLSPPSKDEPLKPN